MEGAPFDYIRRCLIKKYFEISQFPTPLPFSTPYQHDIHFGLASFTPVRYIVGMIQPVPAARCVPVNKSMTTAQLRESVPINAYLWVRNFVIATGYWPRMTADGQLLDKEGHLCNHTGNPAAPAREYYRGDVYEKAVSVKDPENPARVLRDEDGEVVQKVIQRAHLIDGPEIKIGVQNQLSQLDKGIDKVLPSLKSIEMNHQRTDPAQMTETEVKQLGNKELHHKIAELQTFIDERTEYVPRETSFAPGGQQHQPSILIHPDAFQKFEWEDPDQDRICTEEEDP